MIFENMWFSTVGRNGRLYIVTKEQFNCHIKPFHFQQAASIFKCAFTIKEFEVAKMIEFCVQTFLPVSVYVDENGVFCENFEVQFKRCIGMCPLTKKLSRKVRICCKRRHSSQNFYIASFYPIF